MRRAGLSASAELLVSICYRILLCFHAYRGLCLSDCLPITFGFPLLFACC